MQFTLFARTSFSPLCLVAWLDVLFCFDVKSVFIYTVNSVSNQLYTSKI